MEFAVRKGFILETAKQGRRGPASNLPPRKEENWGNSEANKKGLGKMLQLPFLGQINLWLRVVGGPRKGNFH